MSTVIRREDLLVVRKTLEAEFVAAFYTCAQNTVSATAQLGVSCRRHLSK
jgi:hypothetical protein